MVICHFGHLYHLVRLGIWIVATGARESTQGTGLTFFNFRPEGGRKRIQQSMHRHAIDRALQMTNDK